MRKQPKKNITTINKQNKIFGKRLRISYQNTILDKAPIFPKTLEYDDIDKAVFDFVDKEIDIVIDGKLIPTYTLYSNQRFSEYSQMWEHTDEAGNLYLNFKTVNRDKNPSFGKNQGELWNIPGRRNYMILKRDVLEDNGAESTEIYSMKQPYAIDLSYTISFITVTVENLNNFNQKINKIFASRQHYIRPNGHYLPMIIDDISDESSYSISERKFFLQTIRLKVMAYIIEKDDFEVKKYPKSINISVPQLNNKKPKVEVAEYDDIENKKLLIEMTLKPFNNKLEFEFDTEMVVENILSENVRNIRVMINDDLIYTDKGFKIHNGDVVRVQIKPINYEEESVVKFDGVDPDIKYNIKNKNNNSSLELYKSEDIIIE